jgi:glutamyl-tRNA synthetase
MTLDEMVKAFSIERIGKSNAKFDREKLLAFNTDWINAGSPERLLAAFDDYLSINDTPMSRAHLDEPTKRELLRVNAGFRTFADIESKSGFIYLPDDTIVYDEQAVKKVLAVGDNAGYRMLEMLLPQLETLQSWTHEAIESLIKSVCESQSLGLGKVAQPLRVAISGNTISPAIYETLVLLGKDKTIRRIRRALTKK